ncbi:hypothetical protein [Methanocorpusculum sp. GPch4]|uniref:hypothetical protein n=1 Tax=Methanocorpusculum sp. GPch4 TaxID=2527877 RepID=UPI003183D8D9
MGPFDDEPATLEMMDAFIRENGFVHDFAGRRHHEIYLSDPRKTVAGKMKTILRVPVKKSVSGYPVSRMNCSTLLRISSGERGIFGDAEFPGRMSR